VKRIPALSIRQPWAWLIVNGHKDVENREWITNYRGPILIHSGKKLDEDFYPLGMPEAAKNTPSDDELPLGGIVGVAELIDCVGHSDSPWFFGTYGFIFKNARPLPLIQCRGQLGIFDIKEAWDQVAPFLSHAERSEA
jgi:hypothetical protein